jgi:hypothetical protein
VARLREWNNTNEVFVCLCLIKDFILVFTTIHLLAGDVKKTPSLSRFSL